MRHASAPRHIERLLQALGADTEFRNEVLGDLAEEYALRAEWDGARDATRWYRREAARVAPYLLRDWARGLRWRGASRLAGAVAASSVCMIVLESILTTGLRELAVAVTLAPWLGGQFGLVAIPATMFLWSAADGALAGFLAARFNRRAPLPTVLASCVVLTGGLLIMNAVIGRGMIPLWFQIPNAAALAIGVLAGGVLNVRLRRMTST